MKRPIRKPTRPWLRSLAMLAPVALVVGLVAAAPAMVAALGRPSDAGGFTGGYDRLVNAIAQRQWLAVRYDADGEPSVGLRRDHIGQDPRLRDFVNNSYLRSDLGDPSIWKLSDDGLWVEGMDPYAHRIERPLSDNGGWAGQIAFRGGGRGALSLIDLDHPDAAPIRLEAEGAPQGLCDILMPTRRLAVVGSRRAISLCMKDMANPPRPLGSLLLVGDRLLVRAQNRTPVEIRVGRRDVRPVAEGEVAVTAVAPGEVVEIRFDRAILRLKLQRETADISHVEPSGGRAFYPGLRPVAEQLARGMAPRAPGLLRLSYDADLQATAQAALEAGALVVRTTPAPGQPEAEAGDAFKGAVTVMDTATGQVLATASYPLRQSDLSAAHRRTRRGQALLAQNHNFERLPVGSMAKAPFALAILDADPGLATLKLQGGSDARFRTVLGMDLGKGGFDNHALGLTDFPTFIERSNNRYALALMMLAWRNPAGPDPAAHRQSGEPWSLDGRARTDAPPLPVYGDAAAPGPFGWALQPPPGRGLVWPTRLSAIFDVNAGQAGGCRYDVAVWRGLAGPAPACDSALASASPEREQLGLDAIASIRNDYLMSILGGGRSTWSAIKVAEVYSRIVTGRRVQARFTRPSPGPEAAPLPLRNPQSRDLVLEGMRRVTRTGTAARLGTEFAGMGYGPDVELFGKTGTMKVAGEAPSDPDAALLRQLARSDCGLRWDIKAGALKFAAQAPRSQAEAARQILALKETRCRVRIGGDVALAGRVAAEMRRYACGFRDCQPTEFSPLPDGRVLAIAERPTEPPLLDGHAIAVVAIRRPSGQSPRGLTIVVNLQDKRQAESPALAVAAGILRSPAARAWIEGRAT